MEVHFTIPVDPNALAVAGTVLGYIGSGLVSVAGWHRARKQPIETAADRGIAGVAVLLWPIALTVLAAIPPLKAVGWLAGRIAGQRAMAAEDSNDTPL